MRPEAYIHPTADVSDRATIGAGTKVWHHAQVREAAKIGKDCTVGKNVYVDSDVQIGDGVKIQNNCSLYHPAHIEDYVFLGPHVILTNDRVPRAVLPDGTPKSAADWQVEAVTVLQGASLGAGVVVLCGLTIGRWAMVGAGAIVTHDVPDHALVVGNPAQIIGYVCRCGSVRAATLDAVHCPCFRHAH